MVSTLGSRPAGSLLISSRGSIPSDSHVTLPSPPLMSAMTGRGHSLEGLGRPGQQAAGQKRRPLRSALGLANRGRALLRVSRPTHHRQELSLDSNPADGVSPSHR